MIDIDNVKSINIPGLYRIELDDNLPRHVKFWLIRGHELAKAIVLGLIDEIDKGEKVVIIDKGKILESGEVSKIIKKTKQKNIRDAFNKLVGIKS